MREDELGQAHAMDPARVGVEEGESISKEGDTGKDSGGGVAHGEKTGPAGAGDADERKRRDECMPSCSHLLRGTFLRIWNRFERRSKLVCSECNCECVLCCVRECCYPSCFSVRQCLP